jgi:hypothetical protein
MSLKNPVIPTGIDPGTVRLVAQCLNHYATLCNTTHRKYKKRKLACVGNLVSNSTIRKMWKNKTKIISVLEEIGSRVMTHGGVGPSNTTELSSILYCFCDDMFRP